MTSNVVKVFLTCKLSLDEVIAEDCPLGGIEADAPVHHSEDGEEKALLEFEMLAKCVVHITTLGVNSCELELHARIYVKIAFQLRVAFRCPWLNYLEVFVS